MSLDAGGQMQGTKPKKLSSKKLTSKNLGVVLRYLYMKCWHLFQAMRYQ